MNTGGSLDPQGPVAREIAQLWWFLLVLGTAVFVVFACLLAVGLFRRRRESNDAAGPALRDLTRRWIVAGGAVMPVIILVVVFAATIEAMHDVPEEAPPGALVVDIVGRQWEWEVHYPDAGITLKDELHVPVGRPVMLRLTSEDVIHSFWVPQLAGKMDLLPDYTNTLVLEADEPGEHLSMCAEFCGLHHAGMRLRVVVEPPQRFAAWIADRRAGKTS